MAREYFRPARQIPSWVMSGERQHSRCSTLLNQSSLLIISSQSSSRRWSPDGIDPWTSLVKPLTTKPPGGSLFIITYIATYISTPVYLILSTDTNNFLYQFLFKILAFLLKFYYWYIITTGIALGFSLGNPYFVNNNFLHLHCKFSSWSNLPHSMYIKWKQTIVTP